MAQAFPANANSRRAEVVSRAASLFDQYGYAQTSMEDIASSTGIKKPTLYHYFPGKDAILFLIHEEFINLLTDRQDARAKTDIADWDCLLEVMSDIIELMHTHRGHVRVFFEHHRELPRSQYRIIEERRDHYFASVESVVKSAIESGSLRSPNSRLTTLALFGMCNWAYTWYQPHGALTPREIAVYLWDLFMYGSAS